MEMTRTAPRIQVTGYPDTLQMHRGTGPVSPFIVRTGSNGYWLVDLPETYSSSTFSLLISAVPMVPRKETILITSEQVRFVLTFYGFSKSDLARILEVTRPTLYAWLDKKIEPTPENAQRLSLLVEIARSIDPDPQRPLFHGYVERPLPGHEQSLIQQLMDTKMEKSSLKAAIEHIYHLTQERTRRLEETRVVIDQKSSEETLEANLILIENEG